MADLTERQAYEAMFAFLEARYRITKSDELGSLLTGMSFVSDQQTVDPAVWEGWLAAIEATESGNVDVYLRLKK